MSFGNYPHSLPFPGWTPFRFFWICLKISEICVRSVCPVRLGCFVESAKNSLGFMYVLHHIQERTSLCHFTKEFQALPDLSGKRLLHRWTHLGMCTVNVTIFPFPPGVFVGFEQTLHFFCAVPFPLSLSILIALSFPSVTGKLDIFSSGSVNSGLFVLRRNFARGRDAQICSALPGRDVGPTRRVLRPSPFSSVALTSG